jgi:three-Cys-motif partner protein
MTRRRPGSQTKGSVQSGALFPISEFEVAEPLVRQLPHPIWTEHKARLIAKYIYLFELVTKHGTYIDGFAGPQQPDKPQMWAAKLVLEIEPRWLRYFYLYERSKAGYRHLLNLKASLPATKGREIEVFFGDFNLEIDKLLRSQRISQNEATFCLLDQRTFECHWETLAKLSRYKRTGNTKIELFYFLAGWWYRRAVTAIKKESVLKKWWGRADWGNLRHQKLQAVKDEFVRRFKSELGYRSAKPWPIIDHNGRDMYYMIHATDYPEAPALMERSYREAVDPGKIPEQQTFWPLNEAG